MSTYALLDSGFGRKLERFGEFTIDRPCAQAVWNPVLPKSDWEKADAVFIRREKETRWIFRKRLPKEWICTLEGAQFLVGPTDFGHFGMFPEHALGWRWMRDAVSKSKRERPSILNLFAYSGGATLALAQCGCEVCHLDASKKTVDLARRNAAANHLETAPIRWIIDDVSKFLQRELRRGRPYDGILLDPPSFGRGTNQEIFKIDDALSSLLQSCANLLSDHPIFLFLSCHTPGYTPIVLKHLLRQMRPGNVLSGEMVIPSAQNELPSGSYAIWQP